MLTLIFPLKVKMPFSRRFAYILLRFLRTPFTIAVTPKRRRSGAEPLHIAAQRRRRLIRPRPSEAGRFFIMHCPYKGDCSYYSIPIGGAKSEYAVWTYEKPYEAVASIKEYLAFYPSRVEAIGVIT